MSRWDWTQGPPPHRPEPWRSRLRGTAELVVERLLEVTDEVLPLLAAAGWYLLWLTQPFVALAVAVLLAMAAGAGLVSLLLGRTPQGRTERGCRALVVVGAVLGAEALLVTLAPGLVAAVADALLGHL